MKVNKLSEIITYYQNYRLTKHKYHNRALHLRYFDAYCLSDLKRVQIRQYVKLRQQRVKNATINRELSFARAAINAYAYDFEISINNPFADIKLKESETIPHFLTIDDVNKILYTANHVMKNKNLYDFLSLMVYTGARPYELITLTWDNIHLEKRFFIVRDCYSKSGRTLYKYLNDTALGILSNHDNIGFYVFTNQKTGKPYHDFKNQFKRCKKLSKIDCRMYDLRHTYASWLVQNGVGIYTVKELMGHKDISSTMRYAHLDYASYIEALNKIG